VKLLIIGIILWLLRLLIWNTPNDVLNANGFGNIVVIELIGLCILGITCSVYISKHKAMYKSKLIYSISIILYGLFAITPLAMIAIGIYSIAFRGL